jgi:hypothetical protein
MCLVFQMHSLISCVSTNLRLSPPFSHVCALQQQTVRIAGTLRFSTIEVRGTDAYLSPTGHLSSDALGNPSGQGHCAGMSHLAGGGGGGNAGNGAQGCSMYSQGGSCVREADGHASNTANMSNSSNPDDAVDATEPWVFGSGGGRGGGNAAAIGGRGGGRVGVWVNGTVTVHGIISANGADTICVGLVRSVYTGERLGGRLCHAEQIRACFGMHGAVVMRAHEHV